MAEQQPVVQRVERTGTGLPPPAGNGVDKILSRRNCYLAPPRSSSSRSTNRVSATAAGSRPVRSHRYQMMATAADIRLKVRPPANKEVVRRALAPPCRRQSRRWLNFRPTPSRLSNMSVAES